ncbi:MAG: hypothetical protein LC635_00770, partial [Pseudonocardiaceae bacterium]|nr:hypothetical protein [Pseudonocardiaceae bacterium]
QHIGGGRRVFRTTAGVPHLGHRATRSWRTRAGRDAGRGAGRRADLVARYLAGLDRHLAEPIEDCVATDEDGRPCVEARTPLDLEHDLAMPGGHIFHGDLRWPCTEDGGGWGVETDVANVLVCGSGARRGGGVSGIGGHNAAHAVLCR